MAKISLLRVPNGWVPATAEDAEACQRFKLGEIYVVDIVEIRNGAFFRKWWHLVTTVFAIWKEHLPPKEINGKPVTTSRERFRKDIIILAGYYEPVYNAKGEVRLEPMSLAWSKMTEETFAQLYSDTIDAAIHKVLAGLKVSADQLDAWANILIREYA